jgi:hypothetical protein
MEEGDAWRRMVNKYGPMINRKEKKPGLNSM